jgi:Na+-transporting methylmalonyl-CoA/oxaloacetate decarboxylase gamma subunit
MQQHEHNEFLDPTGPKREEIDTSAGYEQSDVRVTGIVVFLASLAIFVAVCGVVTYGMGKLINTHMSKEDGPDNKWTASVNIRQLGNLANNPAMQQKVAQLTQQFPTPRLQEDDGNQDIADLHQREDLLLNNYSWANQAKGQVRIPIERAMELIAQRGLPVAPAAQQEPLLAHDAQPGVTIPLTDGFAPTTYEQELAAARAAQEKQKQ